MCNAVNRIVWSVENIAADPYKILMTERRPLKLILINPRFSLVSCSAFQNYKTIDFYLQIVRSEVFRPMSR